MTALVLHYRKTSRFGLNALLGAVEQDPRTRALPATAAFGLDAAVAAARAALAEGRRPVVGWSFLTASLAEVTAELAAFRAALHDPRVLHVAGGPHPSADPEGTLRAGFDLAARGEGERTLPALLVAAGEGRPPQGVPGLAWLEGGALRTSGRAEVPDLDALPPFALRAGRLGPIELTRGCVWGCRFCHTPFLFKARWRHRSLAAVLRAVEELARREARDVRFLTPSALSYGSPGEGVDLDAVEALLAGARERIGPAGRIFFGTFPSELRPEHVSPRALALVARYCDNRAVILGGQSGSDRMLEAMGRGHDAASVERAAALAVEAGLEPSVDLVFGFPGEEEADREATRGLASRLAALGAKVHAHAFMPLPGTPWAGAAPASIDGATRLLLDRLASAGRAHGAWKAQEKLAHTQKVMPVN
ncbi:MAG TPA: TIGR04013 family B12-binding domain/radical SAM domain-containing protein [Anaeromyxobacteraceae bacterium]|nr:TIGR04013 family B12-binding domain/radical SAM domain-containing protein [Anaeromyxobacteraceae bacterium]